MTMEYNLPVERCDYTLKCVPKETKRQHLLECRVEIQPEGAYSYSEDGFQNRKIIGAVLLPHKSFAVKVSGRVEIMQILFEEKTSYENSCIFRYPFGRTKPGEALTRYFERLKRQAQEDRPMGFSSDYERVLFLMHRLHGDFCYDTGCTTVDTTAEEAWSMGKGVCQDYAHIMLVLCRLSGLAARYVSGLMLGEGKTHAWVEVACGDSWIGFDPTHDLLIDNNYIKFCDGRDASDCKVNLGILFGGGSQHQTINATVMQEKEQ